MLAPWPYGTTKYDVKKGDHCNKELFVHAHAVVLHQNAATKVEGGKRVAHHYKYVRKLHLLMSCL